MSDIDDELLALAGGGEMSSDAGSARGRSQSPASATASPPAKGVATKKAPAKKASKRAQHHGSEEEGEASDADSLQSAPMDESDSDDDSPHGSSRAGDDENKYPVEGMFASHAEKEEIMNLREVEREQIIADRIQEKERQQQNRLLRQLVTNAENEEKKHHKKRKASAADLEDDDEDDEDRDRDSRQRKGSRVRTKVGGNKVGEASSAFDSLRRARMEKEERSRRRDRDRNHRERHPSRSPSVASSRSRRSSDVSWDMRRLEHSRSPPEVKEIPFAEMRDLEKIRLSRTRFARVCFHPGFEETITGCYCRINIGLDPDTRAPVYRIALIKGFTQGRAYAMQNDQGKDIVTDQYIVAAHGKSQREWPFITCSESDFTQTEWERYKAVLQNEGLSLPKRPAVYSKLDEVHRLLNRTWTEEEVSESVRRKMELKARFNGTEVARVESAIAEARDRGAHERADRLQEKLDAMEKPRLAFRTSLSTPSKRRQTLAGAGASSDAADTPSSQQDRLADINAANRKRNSEAVRRAQLRERARVREIEARVERGEHVDDETVRRIKAHGVAKSGSSTPAAATAAASTANGTPTKKEGSPLPGLAKLQQQGADKSSIPTFHRPLMDDDIIGALDLGIDVKI